MVENWTNQKLEFPALTQEKGGMKENVLLILQIRFYSSLVQSNQNYFAATDRWYPPQDIPTHTR